MTSICTKTKTSVEAKSDILKHPEALQQAFEAGRRLVLEWGEL
jgi:hypothetical protein